MQKFALKRLTASDLTFFKWHFEHNNAGNQKAINLSRNVFIDELYPSLPDVIADRGDGKLPLTLYTYGPGLADVYPLQRKIIKNGAYKNWRLNGEFIFTPDETPTRFNQLKPGDIAVMGFEGSAWPTAIHIDYLAEDIDEDRALRNVADAIIPNKGGMKEITLEELSVLIEQASPVENHPIRRFIIDADVVATVQGDALARLRVFRATGRSMSQEELKTARQKAEETGASGEALVAAYFESHKAAQLIKEFEWTSNQNAVAPYDFKLMENGGLKALLDVKSTTADFKTPIHISMAEIYTMATASERYDIYRVFALTEEGGKLRIARDMRSFAKSINDALSALPDGVRIDSVSVDPTKIQFDGEVDLAFAEDDD